MVLRDTAAAYPAPRLRRWRRHGRLSMCLIETCGASGEHEMVDVHDNIVPFMFPTMKSAPQLAVIMRDNHGSS
ncbi:hypothetical protein BCB70_04915 [Cutibacterium modestum]|nr:hypothetical protein BCB70_04915 [Cutibacterium modestum]